jgi:hypothetical protein
MDEEDHMLFSIAFAAHNSYHLFNSNEWEDGGQSSVNPNEGVHDEFTRMKAQPNSFKNKSNFSVSKFDELCELLVPTIIAYLHTTSEE